MSARTLAEPLDRITPAAFVICVALFALGGLFVVAAIPFPTAYDELQHLSFIAALRDAPTLFPQYGTYRVLNEDLNRWTEVRSYIAHPPLYYLLLSPVGDNVPLLRALNLAIATIGFALCARAGVTLLATKAQRLGFLVLLCVFSKPALIAGMINNDNLVLLETGLVFWFIARDGAFRSLAASTTSPDGGADPGSRRNHEDRIPDRPSAVRESGSSVTSFALAAFLALAGWTKFNAFVGLTVWVGTWHLLTIRRREAPLFGRGSVVLAAGVLVGAIPAMVNLATSGTVAYVPIEFLYVAPEARLTYDFPAFVAAFFDKIGRKVLLIDGIANMLPIVALVATFACLSPLSRASSRGRDLAVAAVLATTAFACLHVFYGWNSFRALGSMSDAQSRYYVMLWPGLALAAVLGASAFVGIASEAKQSICALPLNGLFRRLRSSQ